MREMSAPLMLLTEASAGRFFSFDHQVRGGAGPKWDEATGWNWSLLDRPKNKSAGLPRKGERK
jgi:hypothetical protein